MTDPTSSGYDPTAAQAIAPGWYPDSSGAQRWWDGQSWTDHVAAPAGQPLPYGTDRPQLPAGTPVDNGWVWVVALVQLLSVLPLFFFDMTAVIEAAMASAGQLNDPFFGLGGLYALSWGLSFVLYAATVMSAYFDYRRLLSLGAVRPFHWAFAFIPYAIVYLIGRHVVLRKMIRTAGAPLWAHIVAMVLAVAGGTIWIFIVSIEATNAIFERLP